MVTWARDVSSTVSGPELLRMPKEKVRCIVSRALAVTATVAPTMQAPAPRCSPWLFPDGPYGCNGCAIRGYLGALWAGHAVRN